MRFTIDILPYLFLPNTDHIYSFMWFHYHVLCVCVHLYPYQTIADFFKTTTTGFFLSTENSLHCQYCFFISKNLLRALKQTTNLFKTTLSKLAFYDHLVTTKTLKPPQTKPYTCWKLNWTHAATWETKSQVVDVAPGQFRLGLLD